MIFKYQFSTALWKGVSPYSSPGFFCQFPYCFQLSLFQNSTRLLHFDINEYLAKKGSKNLQKTLWPRFNSKVTTVRSRIMAAKFRLKKYFLNNGRSWIMAATHFENLKLHLSFVLILQLQLDKRILMYYSILLYLFNKTV